MKFQGVLFFPVTPFATDGSLDVGGVRAPLLDPTPEHVARLAQLIDHGLEVAGA
ncbi:hypothetical protein [Streptomyces sp. WM6386]|uniref:hypothetical protein n=1 Tax=Streptomyces sp. WM6386 TaxID=1415558 RepID=UPI0026CB1C25